MAAPTAPASSDIVTEAYKKLGIASPTTVMIGRGIDYFLEEVKDDIFNRAMQDGHVRLRSLQAVSFQLTTDGISRYAVPSDMDTEISLSLLEGTHTGTAQTGTTVTVTLAAAEDASASQVEGHYILLTGGTGSGQYRQVTDYSTACVATVTTAWTTTPASDTTYRVIDRATELIEQNLEEFGAIGTAYDKGRPSMFCKVYESGSEYFYLDRPPDASTYGLMTRYYLNIHDIDLTSTLYTNLLTNWRTVLTYGVAAKVAETEDDDKFAAMSQRYEAALNTLIIKELPHGGEFTGFTR